MNTYKYYYLLHANACTVKFLTVLFLFLMGSAVLVGLDAPPVQLEAAAETIEAIAAAEGAG